LLIETKVLSSSVLNLHAVCSYKELCSYSFSIFVLLIYFGSLDFTSYLNVFRIIESIVRVFSFCYMPMFRVIQIILGLFVQVKWYWTIWTRPKKSFVTTST